MEGFFRSVVDAEEDRDGDNDDNDDGDGDNDKENESYLSYARRTKFGTAASISGSLPTLTFMGNCVVNLYSLDYASSYQDAFVYACQLALQLRSALKKRTLKSFRTVYCWQYVHCLRLWSAVLEAACSTKDEELEEGAGYRCYCYYYHRDYKEVSGQV